MFNIANSEAHDWTWSRTSSIQLTWSQPVSLPSILISYPSAHILLGLSRPLFPTTVLYEIILSPIPVKLAA